MLVLCDRNPDRDRRYWIQRLTERYGNAQAADLIVKAYNASGYCAPLLLRRLDMCNIRKKDGNGIVPKTLCAQNEHTVHVPVR